MSMLGLIRVVDPPTLDRLRQDPTRIAEFLHGTSPARPRPSLFQRLFGAKPPPPPADPPDVIDLDKAWHGIHYLLTGDVGPTDTILDFLMDGGEPLGPDAGQDLGYGPARAYDNPAVGELSTALNALQLADLRARYNPEDMSEQGIYPDIWLDEDDSNLDWLIETFTNMRARITQAACAGKCLIVYLA